MAQTIAVRLVREHSPQGTLEMTLPKEMGYKLGDLLTLRRVGPRSLLVERETGREAI